MRQPPLGHVEQGLCPVAQVGDQLRADGREAAGVCGQAGLADVRPGGRRAGRHEALRADGRGGVGDAAGMRDGWFEYC